MAWTGGWFRGPLAARRRWREFAPLTGEVVTVADASHVGLPLPWYRHFVQDHFRGREEVPAEQLRFAIDDPSIRDLLRYKIEQRQLREDLDDVLDESLSPFDAIAAGVADVGLAVVVREVFPDQAEVSVRDLIPEVLRRAVRKLLVGADGRPSLQRVRHALARADERRTRSAELGGSLDQRIPIDTAIQVGAAGDELRALARTWFGETEALSVGQLLLASQVSAFSRVLGWQQMMTSR